eukprot:12885396-Prorocentrum_lima.AAC.1
MPDTSGMRLVESFAASAGLPLPLLVPQALKGPCPSRAAWSEGEPPCALGAFVVAVFGCGGRSAGGGGVRQ